MIILWINLFTMNQDKYIFSQLTAFLDNNKFYRIVKQYDGDKDNRCFTCWNQMLMMIFGQLSNRDSLRDLTTIIDAHKSKAYHLGLGKSVNLSTIARANANRNYRIFEEFAMYMIDHARRIRADAEFEVDIEGNIYAFDSSTISLCLSVFWWATHRKNRGAVKIHTLFDVKTQIPCFMLVTAASVNDMNAMDEIPYQPNAYYIFDRGYVDYKRLYNIVLHSSFFVVRAKKGLNFRRIYSHKIDTNTGVMCDQTIKLTGFYPAKDYPEKLRRVKFFDQEQNRTFVFLTNNFKLTAQEIAMLYKNRWQIELFFKWIKQHLKVKSFWGHTENAVKVQLYCAIIAYCLVAIIGEELKINRPIYTILQIVGFSLLDKTPLKQLLTQTDYQNVKEPNCNLLLFN